MDSHALSRLSALPEASARSRPSCLGGRPPTTGALALPVTAPGMARGVRPGTAPPGASTFVGCRAPPSLGGARRRRPLRRSVLPLRRGDRLATSCSRPGVVGERVEDVTVRHAGAGTSSDSATAEALFHAGQETYVRKWHGPVGWAVYRSAMCAGRRAARDRARRASPPGSSRSGPPLSSRTAARRGPGRPLTRRDRPRRRDRQLRGDRALRLRGRDPSSPRGAGRRRSSVGRRHRCAARSRTR